MSRAIQAHALATPFPATFLLLLCVPIPFVILERSEESRILPLLSGRGRASGACEGPNSRMPFSAVPVIALLRDSSLRSRMTQRKIGRFDSEKELRLQTLHQSWKRYRLSYVMYPA